MNEENWAKRNEILLETAQAIAASEFPYSGAALVCLPTKEQVTRQVYWEKHLTEEERQMFLKYAYAAYNVFGGYGFQQVMALSFEEYMDEK